MKVLNDCLSFGTFLFDLLIMNITDDFLLKKGFTKRNNDTYIYCYEYGTYIEFISLIHIRKTSKYLLDVRNGIIEDFRNQLTMRIESVEQLSKALTLLNTKLE